ncbi:hypothetical protein GCM10020219_016400 [Nonomuraea dietziae]
MREEEADPRRGRGPVQELAADPVRDGQEDPLGGDQPESDRESQRDQGEHADVEVQEGQAAVHQTQPALGAGQRDGRQDQRRHRRGGPQA